jgi:hypothetical protein
LAGKEAVQTGGRASTARNDQPAVADKAPRHARMVSHVKKSDHSVDIRVIRPAGK